MARVVLRVRLVSGDQMDVAYEHAEADSTTEALEQAIAILTDDSGVLRCRHGERLVVIFGRGVAGFELSPRGAVL